MLSNLKQALSRVFLSGQPQVYASLRDSVWLYLALALLADQGGEVNTSFSKLATLTGIKEPTLRSFSGHLRKAGLVGLLDRQSTNDALFVVHALKTAAPIPSHTRRPAANSATVALARSLIKGLGEDEAKLEEYMALCERVPREIILNAYQRARDVPKDKIRKSHAALFQFLIQKYDRTQINTQHS